MLNKATNIFVPKNSLKGGSMAEIDPDDYQRIEVTATPDGFINISIFNSYSFFNDISSRVMHDKVAVFFEPFLFYKCLLAIIGKSINFLNDINVKIIKDRIASNQLAEFQLATRIFNILSLSKEKLIDVVSNKNLRSKIRVSKSVAFTYLDSIRVDLGDFGENKNDVFEMKNNGNIFSYKINADQLINQITFYLKSAVTQKSINFWDLILFPKDIGDSIIKDLLVKEKFYNDKIDFIRIIISSSQKEKEISDMRREIMKKDEEILRLQSVLSLKEREMLVLSVKQKPS